MAIDKVTTEQEVLFEERTGENFSYFYKNFYPRLVYNINGITKDEILAEDLATEAFLRAFEKIDLYEKGKAQFSTWLFTIGRHLAFHQLKKIRKTVSIDVELNEEGSTMKDFIHENENNDEMVYFLNNKKAEIIKNCIDKLKQPYREVILMREIKEMQYKDIAVELGNEIKFNIKIDKIFTVNLPTEISECYSLTDLQGNNVDYTLTKLKEFYIKITINQPGEFIFHGWEPKNLSTIKSQIKAGRQKLIDSSKKEFSMLEEMY